jgi:hypothetical protein
MTPTCPNKECGALLNRVEETVVKRGTLGSLVLVSCPYCATSLGPVYVPARER